MEQLFLGVFFFLWLFLAIYFTSRAVRRFYYYFKNYLYEINEYIHINNLVLIEIRSPNKIDWKQNPFDTKNSMFIEFALPFTLLVHYTFIVENPDKSIDQYWLRNSCSFISKVKNEIRKADTSNILFQNGMPVVSNVQVVNDNCPACKQPVKSSDRECPSCGLVFNA